MLLLKTIVGMSRIKDRGNKKHYPSTPNFFLMLASLKLNNTETVQSDSFLVLLGYKTGNNFNNNFPILNFVGRF